MISLAILFLCVTYAYSEDCSTIMGEDKKIINSCDFSSIYEDEQGTITMSGGSSPIAITVAENCNVSISKLIIQSKVRIEGDFITDTIEFSENGTLDYELSDDVDSLNLVFPSSSNVKEPILTISSENSLKIQSISGGSKGSDLIYSDEAISISNDSKNYQFLLDGKLIRTKDDNQELRCYVGSEGYSAGYCPCNSSEYTCNYYLDSSSKVNSDDMKVSTTSERLKQLLSERKMRQVDILDAAKPYTEKYNVKLNKNDSPSTFLKVKFKLLGNHIYDYDI